MVDQIAFERLGAGFGGEGAKHYAVVAQDGALVFGARTRRATLRTSGEDARTGLHVNTARILRDGVDVAAGALDVHQVDDEVVVSRGPIDEVLVNHPQGVEQIWKFAQEPSGSGDLQVEVALSGVSFERFDRQGLRLRDADGDAIVFARSTWVDAKGVRTPVDVKWDGMHAIVNVPKTLLGRTAFPAELDTPVTYATDGTTCGTLSVGTSPTSPQAAGTTVSVTANATCTGGTAAPEYAFYYLPPGGYWTLGQGYGASATFAWNTTGKPSGTYSFQVRARHQGSTAAYESVQSFTYSLTGGTGSCGSLTVSASPASPQAAGTPVAITGNATCTNGATPEYAFYYLPPGGYWTLGRAYGASSTFNWNTVGSGSGTYTIQVRARAQGGTSAFDSIQSTSYSLTGGTGTCATLATSTSPTSPQVVGTPVAVNANATCTSGATPEYQFFYLPPGGYWTQGQAYGPSSTFNWSTTGKPTGTYAMQVRTRAQGSTTAYQAISSFSYALTSPGTCNTVTLTPSPASPQNVGAPVTFTASATCTNGASPVYEFYVTPPGGAATLAQAYGANATLNWDTTGLSSGTYSVEVHARASTSTAAYQGLAATPYDLNPAGWGVPGVVQMSISPASVPADGATASTISVTVQDIYGNNVGGASVSFGSSVVADAFNPSADATTDSNGAASVTLASTSTGDHVITATSGSASTQGTVTFAPTCAGLFNAAVTTSSIATNPFRIVAADFNKDGKLDIAGLGSASSGGTTTYTLWRALGNGNGTFQAPTALGSYTDGGTEVATADFNKDGKPDLVVARQTYATVLLGNGDGTFQTGVDYSATNGPYALYTVDANNDGNVDVVTVNGAGWVSVMRGNAAGAFVVNAPFAPNPMMAWPTAADFNNDGKVDLLTTNPVSSPGPFESYYGNGDGTFQTAVAASTDANTSWLIRNADFNNDGLPDVLTAMSGTVNVWFNQLNEPADLGGGAGQFYGIWQSSLSATPRDAAGVDIDGNGVKDVVLVLDDGTVSVSRGELGSYFYEFGFWPATTYNVGSAPERMASGDFDGDGKVDIAVVNSGSNSVSVLPNSGCVP